MGGRSAGTSEAAELFVGFDFDGLGETFESLPPPLQPTDQGDRQERDGREHLVGAGDDRATPAARGVGHRWRRFGRRGPSPRRGCTRPGGKINHDAKSTVARSEMLTRGDVIRATLRPRPSGGSRRSYPMLRA
jgi:hypothetical protein